MAAGHTSPSGKNGATHRTSSSVPSVTQPTPSAISAARPRPAPAGGSTVRAASSSSTGSTSHATR